MIRPLLALLCLLTISAQAQEELVRVDASNVIEQMSEALRGRTPDLPRFVDLPKSKAAEACGVASVSLIRSCTAVASTPDLVEAVENAVR